MYSMGDPRYAYRSRSPASIAKQRASMLRTLGIPEGHRRVYGVFVPEGLWQPLQYRASFISKRRGYGSAREFVLSCRDSGWVYEYIPPAPPKGGRNENWADWKLAKALYEEGVSVQEIADYFEMDQPRVERARRRRWKWHR